MKNESVNQFVIGYSILLVSFWVFDTIGTRQMSNGLASFVATAKWFTTVPVVMLAIGWALTFLLNEKADARSHRHEELQRFTGESRPVQGMPTNQVPNHQNKNNEPTKPNPEKREAEETLERTAFPLVEKTRGAREALEASLDEF